MNVESHFSVIWPFPRSLKLKIHMLGSTCSRRFILVVGKKTNRENSFSADMRNNEKIKRIISLSDTNKLNCIVIVISICLEDVLIQVLLGVNLQKFFLLYGCFYTEDFCFLVIFPFIRLRKNITLNVKCKQLFLT